LIVYLEGLDIKLVNLNAFSDFKLRAKLFYKNSQFCADLVNNALVEHSIYDIDHSLCIRCSFYKTSGRNSQSLLILMELQLLAEMQIEPPLCPRLSYRAQLKKMEI
jgi:hypothetical protein